MRFSLYLSLPLDFEIMQQCANHQNVFLSIFSMYLYPMKHILHLMFNWFICADMEGGVLDTLWEDKDLNYTCMASRRNIQYSRLPTYENEDDNYDGRGRRRHDPRFDYSPNSYDKIPWKSIALALFLLFLGCLLLLLAFFILTGHMGGDTSQAYGLLGLGLLTFLPGMLKVFISGSF